MSPATARRWWRSVPRAWRVLAVVAATAAVLEFTAFAIDTASPSGSSRGSASLRSTAPTGYAAYAQLLARYGHRVSGGSTRLARNNVSAGATVMVASGSTLHDDDLGWAREFVTGGGRVVLIDPSAATLALASGSGLQVGGNGRTRWTVADPDLAPIRTVAAAGDRAFTVAGGLTPSIGSPDRALLLRIPAGKGEIALLADGSPLDNAHIALADNASLGVALAGNAGTSIVFAQNPPPSGYASIPTRWQLALAVGASSLLVFMWARAVRIGPPEARERDLAPPRADYVRAVARTLARARDRAEVGATLQRSARDTLARRAGLPAAAGEAEVVGAATLFGLDAAEAGTFLAPVRNDDDLVALGRATAKLNRSGRVPARSIASPEEGQTQ